MRKVNEVEEAPTRRTRLNHRTNLLEMENYHYEVQDIPDPNLLREFFEYTEVPKVGFNFRTSPYGMPEQVYITVSTFRDGQQARPPYTVQQIAHIFDLLHKLGGKSGLIQATEFFMYSAKSSQVFLNMPL